MSVRPSCLFLLTTTLAAQTTWIVETGNPLAMPSLAAAVAAASDGDVIRIRNGIENVGGLSITKSLRIVGEGNGPFGIGATVLSGGMQGGGPLTITVGAGKDVCIANCALGVWFGSQFGLSLAITGCQGRVTLQDAPSGYGSIDILASRQVLFSGVTFVAESPIQIATSTAVFARCTISGRPADYETSATSAPAAGISQSTVHCVDSTIRGGDGDTHWSANLPGSRAVTLNASTLTVAGSAAVIATGSLSTAAAILAGNSLVVLDPPLAPTIAATNTTVVQQPLPSVQPTNFASGQSATLALHTPIGSLSALLVGMPGDRFAVAGVTGDLWLDPQVLCTPVLAVQNGSLGWTVVIPPSPALFATPIRWQAAMLHQGAVVLGAPGSALLH